MESSGIGAMSSVGRVKVELHDASLRPEIS